MRYLPVSVLRDTSMSDSSLGGVTSDDSIRLVVPCEDGHVTMEDIDNSNTPTVILLPGKILDCPHFRPETEDGSRGMFGGNFVYTSDSRFRRKYGNQPIQVHDRFES